MIFWGAALLLTVLTGAPEGEAAPRPVHYAQMTVRQQIIVRVPAQPMGTVPRAAPIRWKEGKAVKCVAARSIAGATLLGRNSVDLVMRDSSRVRAKLQKSCPALDYYRGFYISPHADGMICAGRDTIRSRVGGHCEIERFRWLRPVLKD